MAGITKHPKSKYWTAIFYDATGTKYRRSTKVTSAREARAIAEKWEEVAKAGSQRALTEATVRKVCAELLEKFNGEKLRFHTTREWFNEWLATKAGTVADKSRKQYARAVKWFLDHLGARADLTIRAVTVADVRSYRDKLAARPGNSAVNTNHNFFMGVVGPLRAALRMGYIDVNPAAALPPLTDDSATRDTFTPQQVMDLLAAADGDWRGAILAGYTTGQRLRDVCNLTWGAIDADGGTLSFVAMKTKRKQTVPIHPALAEWLTKRASGPASAPIFPTLAGQLTSGKKGLSAQFLAIMEKAKITGRLIRGADGKGRKLSSLSFHSLRHSFNSHLAAAGVTREVRKQLTGHMDDAAHDVYLHHSPETLRDAVAKLPQIG